jgi:hypothetical protein
MQSFVAAVSEVKVALISEVQRFKDEILRTFLSLFRISHFKLTAHFHHIDEARVSSKEQVSEMG